MGIFGYILRIIIVLDYGEDLMKALIPFAQEYTMCTLACNPIFFWLYIGSVGAMCVSVCAGNLLLMFLFFLLAMVFYSIILFAVFVSTDSMKSKICAMIIFLTDVVAGVFGMISLLGSVIFG